MAEMKDNATTSRIERDEIHSLSPSKVDGYESYGLVKSRYDDLSLPRTVWLFKRVAVVVLSVYTGYLCEGIEVGRPVAQGTLY